MKKSHNFKRVSILALVVLAISMVSVSASPENIDSAKLNGRIHFLIEKYNIPDAEIVVIRNDSVIYKFVKNSVNEGRNYLIGSCSKSFTALAVMMLSEKGEIDIDKPVKTYLPWFVIGDSKKVEQITVRHLLNQTSGIGSQYGFFDFPTEDFSVYRTKLTEHLSKVQLVNEPGKEFSYSNLNYLLLGLVVESVTKGKYAEFLSDSIFSKIGMRASYAGFSESILNKNVEPYQYFIFNRPFKSRIYPHSDHCFSYGYISSNTSDLSDYLKFIMHHGITANSDTLINASSYSNLTTPAKGNYAMGWLKVNYNNTNLLGHSGLDENYSAVLTICPDSKTGIVVLSNVNSLEFCNLSQTSIIDMLAGKSFFDPFSMEFLFRWIPGIIALLTFGLMLFNLRRWKRYSFKAGFLSRALPLMRLILGFILSISGIILIYRVYHISVFSVINFQPDIVFSVILILIFGSLSSISRYFGTYSKGKIAFLQPVKKASERTL